MLRVRSSVNSDKGGKDPIQSRTSAMGGTEASQDRVELGKLVYANNIANSVGCQMTYLTGRALAEG